VPVEWTVRSLKPARSIHRGTCALRVLTTHNARTRVLDSVADSVCVAASSNDRFHISGERLTDGERWHATDRLKSVILQALFTASRRPASPDQGKYCCRRVQRMTVKRR
jgi:hypothetical protein